MWQPLDGSPVRQLTAHPPPRTGSWARRRVLVLDARPARPSSTRRSTANLWLQPVPAGAGATVDRRAIPARPAFAPAATADGRSRRVHGRRGRGVVRPLEPSTDRRGAARRRHRRLLLRPGVVARRTSVASSWMAWNVPDMPWDRARLVTAVTIRPHRGAPSGAPAASVQQPRWLPDGTPGRRPRRQRLAERVATATGRWSTSRSSTAVRRGDRASGRSPSSPDGRPRRVHPQRARLRPAVRRRRRHAARCTRWPEACTASCRGRADRWPRCAAARARRRSSSSTTPTTWERTVARGRPAQRLGGPRSRRAGARRGDRPRRRDRARPAVPRRRPRRRLLCWVHGGPTDQWQVTFMPRLAYWRAQGWYVLVRRPPRLHRSRPGVPAGDAAALGRARRHRRGRRRSPMPTTGLGRRRRRTVVIGASAGGFTALGVAAAAPDLVAGVAAVATR